MSATTRQDDLVDIWVLYVTNLGGALDFLTVRSLQIVDEFPVSVCVESREGSDGLYLALKTN